MASSEELFIEKKKEILTTHANINIVEVPDSDLKHGDRKFKGACLISDPDNDKKRYKLFTIKIDESLPIEKKLIFLLHEYGHVLHYIELEYEKIGILKSTDRDEWTALTEVRAYRFQLEEGKKYFESGNKFVLPLIIDEIKKVPTLSDISEPYKVAHSRIIQKAIWNECILLI